MAINNLPMEVSAERSTNRVEVIGVLGDRAASDASAGRPILAPLDVPPQALSDGIGYCEARCQAETDRTHPRYSFPASY